MSKVNRFLQRNQTNINPLLKAKKKKITTIDSTDSLKNDPPKPTLS
jgi:hypothetical protein